MTPQERQLIDELFDRLANLESTPRDPDAERAIAAGLARAREFARRIERAANRRVSR